MIVKYSQCETSHYAGVHFSQVQEVKQVIPIDWEHSARNVMVKGLSFVTNNDSRYSLTFWLLEIIQIYLLQRCTSNAKLLGHILNIAYNFFPGLILPYSFVFSSPKITTSNHRLLLLRL